MSTRFVSSLARSRERVFLHLAGGLTARNAEDLGAALHYALNSAERIVIDLDDVTGMDPVGLHILCRCLGDALRMKKSLRLRGCYLVRVRYRLDECDLACPGVCGADARECALRETEPVRWKEESPQPSLADGWGTGGSL